LLAGSDGALYGTIPGVGDDGGTVFRLNQYGTTFESPTVAQLGPDAPFGSVFSLNQDGTCYTVLYRFSGGADGSNPYAGLIRGSDGALYGTTVFGGDMNLGAVFKLSSSPAKSVVSSINIGGPGIQWCFTGGAAGQTYNIEAVTNVTLTNGWQAIGSAAASIDGRFQFHDTDASNYPTRFYRSAAP
jgi:uncharacterized repeat protein (TIGR03803 family)